MKLKYLLKFIVGISLCNVIQTYAQQDAQYTQYMYNTISINPAYAGSRGVFSVTGLHRSQWVGLEGAPRTFTLSGHTPIGRKNKVGLGVSLIRDEIGPTQETYIDIDLSYTIQTSIDGKLSFGLKAGGNLLDVDFNRLSLLDQQDVVFDNLIDNKFNPNIGLGIYYHTDKWYVGLSAPNVLETEHYDRSTTLNNQDAASFIAKERINYYGIAGYTFDVNEDVKLKPAVLVKAVSGAPLQVDLSANALLYEKFILGLGYRWDAAFTGMLGFHISDSMLIGLAYDRETTELGKTEFNDGTYEIFLRFELFKKYNRLITPRFF
ncbi:PorP/SprF family type IX secretion system membrane protein [Aquimarina rhabdastrellae]